MKTLIVALVLLLVVTAGCARKTVDGHQSSAIDRVKVTQTGIVYLNGKQVSLEELKKDFVELKAKNGSVWYYRDNPQGEPREQAMDVIKAVVEAKLPVRMCVTEAELNQSP
jgi:biopolymer transport protein ExbD